MNADEHREKRLPPVEPRALDATALIVWCLVAFVVVLLCAVLFGR